MTRTLNFKSSFQLLSVFLIVALLCACRPRVLGVAPSGVSETATATAVTEATPSPSTSASATSTPITYEWNNSSGGPFSTLTNWSSSVEPGASETAIFDLNATYTVTFSASESLGQAEFNQGIVTLSLAANTLTLIDEDESMIVADSTNTASVEVSGGTLAADNIILAPDAGSTATLSLTGAGAVVTVSGDIYVGGDASSAGGTATLSVGTGASIAVTGKIKIYAGGVLQLAGGTVTATGGIEVLNGGQISASQSTTVASNLTVSGGMTLTVAATKTLTQSGTVTNAASSALTKAGTGTLTLSGTQSHGTSASLVISGGTVNLNADVGPGAAGNRNLAISVAASTALNFGATQHLRSLTISSTGVATLTSGGSKVLYTKSLSIDSGNGAKLDLTDNDMIIDYTGGATVQSTIYNLIKSGVENGGAWDLLGPGIKSTSAANQPGGLTILGMLDNADAGYATFSGETVTSTMILVKYTWFGDCDLTGTVSLDDFSLFTDGFNGVGGSSAIWLWGDFDYSGAITSDDFNLYTAGNTGQTGTL